MLPSRRPFLALSLVLLSARLVGQTTATAGDTCAAATAETGALPLAISSTTVGATDDYWHDSFVLPPQCTASGSSCAGGGSNRGIVYDGTGRGPDLAYRIVTSANCTLSITLDPTRPPVPAEDDLGDDLALFVFQTTCSSGLTDCVCVSDEGLETETETVSLDAIGGQTYFVLVDAYEVADPFPDPPMQGPFDLTISVTSGSCTLCPDGGCGGGGAIFSSGFEDGPPDEGACSWSARVPELCTT